MNAKNKGNMGPTLSYPNSKESFVRFLSISKKPVRIKMLIRKIILPRKQHTNDIPVKRRISLKVVAGGVNSFSYSSKIIAIGNMLFVKKFFYI